MQGKANRLEPATSDGRMGVETPPPRMTETASASGHNIIQLSLPEKKKY